MAELLTGLTGYEVALLTYLVLCVPGSLLAWAIIARAVRADQTGLERR